MLTDSNLEFTWQGIKGTALCWIIGEDVLYDLALSNENADIFLEADEVIDISSEYPDYNGITVRFLKNGITLEELQTSEYFGSILLSNPLVVNLVYHKYGIHVMSPNAKFINYKFEVENLDLNSTYGWYPEFNPNDESINAICTQRCNCGRNI